jgi:hypothetical protein
MNNVVQPRIRRGLEIGHDSGSSIVPKHGTPIH